ncbi:OSTA/TMEM184 family protein [Sporobolomyces koalae]|uniref:OSTA/TMEM184 family protein n=1 Tax=Sporobolomyces koalae TaxID=500713 RepID=UPI003170E9DB
MGDVHYASSGCPLAETLPRDPVPFFSQGEFDFKAHDVGWLVAGFFSVIATWTSFWQVENPAQAVRARLTGLRSSFFYNPTEQRLIVRILFMPIIYSWCSFFSYYFVHQALYWQLARDCYEAIIVGSFFYLLLSYLSKPRPTAEEPIPQPLETAAQRAAQLRSSVKHVHIKKWIWPLGFLKWRPARGGSGEGESFLWLMRVLVGQYVVVRPLTTLAAVIGEYTGYYCLASWSPKFVHVWASAFITVSVTVAMYCILQLYVVFKDELAPFDPVLKFAAVKLVVFFTFWQETCLSLLVTIGVIKNRAYWSAEEIVIGIAGLLSCFEMMVFAFLHVKSFSYLPYRALAAPVSFDNESPSPDVDESAYTKQLTPAEWAEWDARVKQQVKDQSRLAQPKKPKKRIGNLPITKPDGLPILQQTKKWPAFVKCLRMTDLGRELAQETRWVVQRGKVELTQDLLEADRIEDHEKIAEQRRPAPARRTSCVDMQELDLGEDLTRLLRESEPASLRGTKIDRNGIRVLTKRDKYEWSSYRDQWTSESHETKKTGEEHNWWTRTVNSFGRGGRPPIRPAQTLRIDKTTSTGRHRICPGDDIFASVNVPLVLADSSIPLLPPHRLDTPLIRNDARHYPPPQATDLGELQHGVEGTETSQDSLGHLPQTTSRPHSFIPPAQLGSPTPAPFSSLDENNSMRTEQQAQTVSRLTLASPTVPPAAFFSAAVPSSLSRGLPAGAAPSYVV